MPPHSAEPQAFRPTSYELHCCPLRGHGVVVAHRISNPEGIPSRRAGSIPAARSSVLSRLPACGGDTACGPPRSTISFVLFTLLTADRSDSTANVPFCSGRWFKWLLDDAPEERCNGLTPVVPQKVWAWSDAGHCGEIRGWTPRHLSAD